MVNNLIAYIQTPEGLLVLIGIVVTVVLSFWGSKKIKKQRGGNNSTNIQGDEINFNVGNKETKIRR